MQFEYTEYHNAKIEDNELLDDMKKIVKESNNSSLTMAEYDEKGKFNSSDHYKKIWSMESSAITYRC